MTLQIHYPLEFNWKMCMLKRFQKLTKNDSTSENQVAWVSHNVTDGLWNLRLTNRDLDPSETVLHQWLCGGNFLPILRNTYGGHHGKVWLAYDGGAIDVTANGPRQPDQRLLWIKGHHDENRRVSFTMELNQTGDGTNVKLVHSVYLYCKGQSCGQNGLNPSGQLGPRILIDELYVNGWSATDRVETLKDYNIVSYIGSCKRVGKLKIDELINDNTVNLC